MVEMEVQIMGNSDGRRRLGAWGEQAAANFVRTLGWRVVDQNWRCTAGEVDLVAHDETGAVVLIEVKTRSGLGFGAPLESITWRKQAKLRELAVLWRREHPEAGGVRVDAIGVLRDGQDVTFSHVRGVA